MKKLGIDVSAYNGGIDWEKASKNIEFCFIRAGYGGNHVDTRFMYNAVNCVKYKVPFGIYWFSYALSEKDAIDEANYACDYADKYNPILPICYDWEYDSDNYAKKMGVNITNETREKFARAFLEQVRKRGYEPMLYSNPDYVKNKGFKNVAEEYKLWLAQWGVSEPSIACDYWQQSYQGSVNGIQTNVDVDVEMDTDENAVERKDFSGVLKKVEERYVPVANDIIFGKYGAGTERMKKLKQAGYDYTVAQLFVNEILK